MILRQASFLAVAGVMFCAAFFVERVVFHVIERFEVTSVDRYGPNVVISGTLRKARPCVLIQDVQAYTSDGHRLEAEFLDRDAGATSRPAIQGADQPFGPWVVKGGAGESVSLYALHRCHVFWTHETKLVTVRDDK
jgi:hypothetical protein